MSLTLRCSKYLLKYISEGEIKITVAPLLKKEDTIKLNASKEVNPLTSYTKQWRIHRGTRTPSLFLDQIEARRAEKIFLEKPPPPHFNAGSGWPAPPHPLPFSWRSWSATAKENGVSFPAT